MKESTRSYRIKIIGCDDTTEFDFDISEQEAVFLRRIALASVKTSDCLCMPILTLDGAFLTATLCPHCNKRVEEQEGRRVGVSYCCYKCSEESEWAIDESSQPYQFSLTPISEGAPE